MALQWPQTETDLNVAGETRVALIPDEKEDVDQLRSQLLHLQSALRAHDHTKLALEESQERYRQLFDRVPTGLYQVSAEGHILLGNPALLRIFGFETLQEAQQVNVNDLYAPSHSRRSFRAAIEEKGEIIGLEKTYFRKDGGLIFVRESARPVRNAAGEIEYYEGVIEDITPFRRALNLERDSNSVLNLLAENQPLDCVLRQILALLSGQWPEARFAIYRRNSDALRLAAHCCPRAQDPPLGSHLIFEKALPAPALPAVTGTSIWVPATATSESCWSVPISSGDEALLGVLTAEGWSREPGDEEKLIIDTAARFAAVAIEQRTLHLENWRKANYDPLTGLPNQPVFKTRLELALSLARKQGHRAALISINLNNYRDINETFGAETGDLLLRAAAQRLSAVIAPEMLLARLADDEFSILLPSLEVAEEAMDLATRCLESLSAPFEFGDMAMCSSVSMGIVVFPDDAASAAAMSSNADAALFAAKSSGRNVIRRYEPTAIASVRSRLDMEVALRRALERKEFELYYQPQWDRGNRLVGVEALLRWNKAEDVVLGPAYFMPVAEDTGLVSQIGDWVIDEACRQAAEWKGNPELLISVNISPVQLHRLDLVDIIQKALDRHRLSPDRLMLEITEGGVMRNPEEASEQLTQLRAMGVRVAVDDFGTGYSSLSYLQQLPLDVLKIDRSFVMHLGQNEERSTTLVRAIVDLARGFGLQTVAEGVESPEQLEELRSLGVDTFQGYLLGRPVRKTDIAKLLSA
jgi:diguanylate cyclase (GGDEF)-like protein/PAS domain S-box-containing protein